VREKRCIYQCNWTADLFDLLRQALDHHAAAETGWVYGWINYLIFICCMFHIHLKGWLQNPLHIVDPQNARTYLSNLGCSGPEWGENSGGFAEWSFATHAVGRATEKDLLLSCRCDRVILSRSQTPNVNSSSLWRRPLASRTLILSVLATFLGWTGVWSYVEKLENRGFFTCNKSYNAWTEGVVTLKLRVHSLTHNCANDSADI